MAQDDQPTAAADKGKCKGKAVENGKPEEVKKDKDGKPIANGKKEDEKDECMRRRSRHRDRKLTPTAATEDLSEEDQQLKSELDMLVERLTV